jgi:multiple sugar transport system permease protein
MFVKKKPIAPIIIIGIFLAITGFPFYLMFVGAFKPSSALTSIPPDINPFINLVTKNFTHVVLETDVFVWMGNSFIVSGFVALLTMLIAATAGYVLARINFPFNNLIFVLVIITMIMPRQILLIPNFLVALNLGLVNSLFGVIVTTVAPAFGIFLCRQFMLNIPKEMSEAAEIDGCYELRTFFHIIVPMSLPALGAIGIFAFFAAFNDYLWQLVMISNKSLQTVPIGIAMFAQKSVNRNLGYQLMTALIVTVPLLALFIACQKFFIKGITLGGVKG